MSKHKTNVRPSDKNKKKVSSNPRVVDNCGCFQVVDACGCRVIDPCGCYVSQCCC